MFNYIVGLSSVYGAYLFTSICMIAFNFNYRHNFHVSISLMIFIDSIVAVVIHTPLLSAIRNGLFPTEAWYLISAFFEFMFLVMILLLFKFNKINFSNRILMIIICSVFFIILQALRMLDRHYDINLLNAIYTPIVLLVIFSKFIIITMPPLGALVIFINNNLKLSNNFHSTIWNMGLIAMFDRETIKRNYRIINGK